MSDAMQALLIRCARAEGNLEASEQARQAAEARVAELEAKLENMRPAVIQAYEDGRAKEIAAKEQAEAKLAEAKQQISNLIHEGGKARNDARGWLASFYDESD